MRFLAPILAALLSISLGAAPWNELPAQEAASESTRDASAKSGEDVASDETPPPLTEYLGRRIAPTMHYSGASWLTRDVREAEENSRKMLEALKVKPGQTICDLGCGNGYHTLRLAEMVGREGKVLAVDIQKEMLDMLAERAQREGLSNIEQIHSTVVDPKLPEGSVDLVLMVDVYHEFSHPAQMLLAIRKSLKEDGRVVLVEFRGEDPEVPILPLHKMTREQIVKELAANGFEAVDEFNELPWQHMIFFGKLELP